MKTLNTPQNSIWQMLGSSYSGYFYHIPVLCVIIQAPIPLSGSSQNVGNSYRNYTPLWYKVETMADDDLVTQGTQASAAKVLTDVSRNIQGSVQEGLNLHFPSLYLIIQSHTLSVSRQLLRIFIISCKTQFFFCFGKATYCQTWPVSDHLCGAVLNNSLSATVNLDHCSPNKPPITLSYYEPRC